jgi:serralysin
MAYVSGTNISDTLDAADGVTWYSDTIYGFTGYDSIYGLFGDDHIVGGADADYLDGGDGSDTAYYFDSTVGVSVSLATGRGYYGTAEGDVLVNIENLAGSGFADTLEGNGAANTLYGGEGGDWLKGGGGADSLYGDSGNDALKGGGGSNLLVGGAGIDTVLYSDATAGVDVRLANHFTRFHGSYDGDQLYEIETVVGSAYGDTLYGDEAVNVIEGRCGNDTLAGWGGDDTLWGGDGFDSLYGGYGNDFLYGDAGNDTLDGQDGNDLLRGGGGADMLVGGSGIDTVDYTTSPTGVYVWLHTYAAGNGDAQGDTFSGIENITGSAYFDTLYADDNVNVLNGGGGNDVLFGYGGADTLLGEDGDDTLYGGSGADTLIGRAGNDTYFVDNAGDVITEFGGQGADTVASSVSYILTSGADIERLATDAAFGTEAINLTGNASGNVVIGNDGNNIINGGDGRDELIGRGGQDSFLFNTALNAATNVDVITDFNVADDQIFLDDAIFSSSLGLGYISAGEFVIGTATQDANDRIIYNGNTGALSYDNDGVGGNAAVQFATLGTGLALTYLDFYVV